MTPGWPARQTFTVGIASGASTTSLIDLGARSFSYLAVRTSMATSAVLTVFGSDSSTGTFSAIAVQTKNTAAAVYNNITISTAASGNWAVFDMVPLQYIKLAGATTITDGGNITVVAYE